MPTDQEPWAIERAYQLARSAVRDGMGPPGPADVMRWATWCGTTPAVMGQALRLLVRHRILRPDGSSGLGLSTSLSSVDMRGPAIERGVGDDAGELDLSVPSVSVVRTTSELRRRLGEAIGAVVLVNQRAERRGVPEYYRATYHCMGEGTSVGEAAFEHVARVANARKELPEAFLLLYGRPLGRVVSAFDAVRADESLADELGIEVGEVTLVRDMLLHDTDGVPCSLGYTFFRADRFSFVASST